MAGWIKLHRDLADHWLWDEKPFSRGQAWIDLLLWARHKPGKASIEGTLFHLEVGQQARSVVTLSKHWGWERRRVQRFLNSLSADGMIVQQTNNRTSVITICNYREYQEDSRQSGSSNGTADGHQTEQQPDIKQYTIEEGEEGKKGRSKPICSMNDAFEVFWEAGMRKAGKATAVTKFEKRAKEHGDPMEFADMLVADIGRRNAAGQLGFDKMMPSTYLHQKRWEDEAPSDCPHQAIVAAWNEEMPSHIMAVDPDGWLPNTDGHHRLTETWEALKVKEKRDKSGMVVQNVEQGAAWFRGVFRRLAKSPRLLDEASGQWCKLSWAVKTQTVFEIAQGGYDQ